MPIEMDWLDDRKSIIVWRMSGAWTMKEFAEVYPRSVEMCNSVNHWVNSIVVDEKSDKLFNMLMATGKQRDEPDPPNYDMAAMVMPKSNYSRMIEIMSESPVEWGRVRVFYEYEDALAFVEERQKELAETPVPSTGRRQFQKRKTSSGSS